MEDLETSGGFRGEWGFLSNMWPCPCQHGGKVFASSEHLYQWLKVEAGEEFDAWREKIFSCADGKLAKKIAKQKGFPSVGRKMTSGQWENFRLSAMETALRSKFSSPELRKKLEESAGVTLVEFNHWRDVFWGVSGGMGRNELGGMLMRLRAEFAENVPAARLAPVCTFKA